MFECLNEDVWVIIDTSFILPDCSRLRLYYTPTHRVGAILQSPCPSVSLSVRPHFRNRYLSFYWKKWFYIWYMALAWWLVPCLPFPGLLHIYFLFTVRLTNEWVGVFLARRSLQHLVNVLLNLWPINHLLYYINIYHCSGINYVFKKYILVRAT